MSAANVISLESKKMPTEPTKSNEPLVLPDDSHNRTLLDNVHPASWKNPEPDGTYNLVVVGGGTAGLISAAGAAGLGAKVALIERHLLGGDCLNYGCVPSKGVLRAAHAAYDARNGEKFGVTIKGSVEVDFAASMERMRRLRADISHHDSAQRFSDLGIDLYLGNAKFVSRDEVEVDGKRLKFKRAVIATGARAAAPPIEGLDQVDYLTNESFFSLTELPKHLLVIGAGPIGSEMAQAFRRFGSEVSIVSLDPRVLPREDPDASEIIGRQFEREGMNLILGAQVKRVEQRGDKRVVHFEIDGKADEVVGDALLIAVGRKPNTDGLNLEVAGVEYGRQGVVVNDRMRTSNKKIFAAGDICSKYKFTHAADAMARIVLQNAFFFGRKKASSLVMPWATYTDPELAHVGMQEKEARDVGHDAASIKVDLAEIDRAILEGDTEGFAKVIYDRKKGKILGATIVARHAGEMIGEMSLAITAGLTLGSLASTIHPYPTQSEVLKRVGDSYNRERLTPGLKRWFERWFAFLR